MRRKPQSVLFLHSGGGWIRGSENALLTAVTGLDRALIRPSFICGHETLGKLARSLDIQTTVLPFPEIMIDGAYRRVGIFRWATAVRRVQAFARTLGACLIYCNGGSSCQIGYYAAKLAKIPALCHLHSPYNRRYILLYRLHRAAATIFVSHAIERSIRAKQRFHGECRVVHNGVDVERFQPARERDPSWRERFGIARDAVVFGQVASLILRKGTDLLLRAFQSVLVRHPNAHLLLVGDGGDRRQFEQLASQLGLSTCTTFAGSQTDPLPFYRHVIDVNVLASRSDAFPLSILEAAACGLSNVGARVDGIPESIVEGENGLLFAPDDVEMLSQKLSDLAANAALRLRMGGRGRELAVESFSKDRYCRSIQDVILAQMTKRVPACD